MSFEFRSGRARSVCPHYPRGRRSPVHFRWGLV